MAVGKVKWFNDLKGYGFISANETNDDIFVHFSAVEMDGFKSLKEGQEVNYEAEKSDKGWKAKRVTPIGQA